jgi:hypothetical protein
LDRDEAEAMLRVIPVMYASKMISAHREFIAEMEALRLDDLLEAIRQSKEATAHH